MRNNRGFIIAAVIICLCLTACGRTADEEVRVAYGRIECDFSALTPETAKAYTAVMDELSEHLGYDEKEASEGECLHGGFVRDLDGDGVPELCLLLKTSPRESGGWEGTPVYGWYPPTLRLYTYRDGRAALVWEYDLYFGTAGRESAAAALLGENGMQYVIWDFSDLVNQSNVECFALVNGALRKTDAHADAADASRNAATAQEFLDSLGEGRAQLLLYNNSGDAKIEGEANARELRAALAATAG